MVERSITPAVQAALDQSRQELAVLYEAEFDSGTVQLWSGFGELTWGAKTFLGASDLISIAEVSETTEVRAAGITVTFEGVQASTIAQALSEKPLDRFARVWLAEFDNGVLILDPVLIFSGRMGAPVLGDTGDTATYQVNIESRLVDLQRPRVRRYTDEDQKIDHPTDVGLQYVESLQDAEIVWGRTG